LPQPIKGKSKKQKRMKKLFTLCLAALAVFAFAACSDDDDSGSASSNSIVGTWKHQYVNPSNDFYVQEELILTSDNQFSERGKEIFKNPYTGVDETTYYWSRGTYTYFADFKQLEMTATESSESKEIGYVYSYTVVLSGNTMTLAEPDGDHTTYYRQ